MKLVFNEEKSQSLFQTNCLISTLVFKIPNGHVFKHGKLVANERFVQLGEIYNNICVVGIKNIDKNTDPINENSTLSQFRDTFPANFNTTATGVNLGRIDNLVFEYSLKTDNCPSICVDISGYKEVPGNNWVNYQESLSYMNVLNL